MKRNILYQGNCLGLVLLLELMLWKRRNAESEVDFIHKMKIAAKEAEGSKYWLWLCQYSTNYPDYVLLLAKLAEVNSVLGKILSASKRKSLFSYFLSFFIF